MDTKALRQKVLDLAIRGKLVPQNPNDEPASVLLERIRQQKQQMVKDGKLKAKDIKNDTVIFVGEDNLHYEKFADGSVKCIEDEIPFDLPDGWAWTRLQSITSVLTDGTHKTPKYSDDGYIFLSSRNVTSGKIDWDNIMYIPESLHQELYTRLAPKVGDILLAKNGTTGVAAIVDREEVFDIYVSLALIRIVGNVVDPLYVLRAIGSSYIQEYFDSSLKGIGVPNLHLEHIRKTLLPIPPYSEQGRIVSRADMLLPLVEDIADDEKELYRLVSVSKAKILDLAIRGQLVPQDPTDEPASVLLERIRAEKEELVRQGKIKRDRKESVIFRGEDNSYYEKIGKVTACIDSELPFELPADWCWCRLGSICTSIQYGLSNSAEPRGTHRLLRITDIQNGKVDWDSVPFTSVQDAGYYSLQNEDIVFARTGATVGKSYLISDIPYDTVYASYLIRIRLFNGIDARYIYDFFNSDCYWTQITSRAVGVGQPNCNGTSLGNLLVPIPPTGMQNRIITSASSMMKCLIAIEKSLN